MNQNSFLDRKPGRDLDIKVALEVMGYIWLKHLLQFSAELAVKWLGTTADLKDSCGMYVVVPDSQFVGLKERENHAEAVLNFSTEIDPANQVIVRMKELGYDYHLEIETKEDTNVHYVYFEKSGSRSEGRALGFVNLPEAICKAALITTLCNK